MQKVDRLIELLCEESGVCPPTVGTTKFDVFRALVNVRPPMPASEEFLRLQDEYLSERAKERGVADVGGLTYDGGIALWQGDITRLNADAIVNACNSALLGCFAPLHDCIDNAIHTNAGVQVRLDCNAMMKGAREPNGRVRVTKGYNLPCRYIFHTVGPIVAGRVTRQNRVDLLNCYTSCLEKAAELKLGTIAFCCLSTGVFRFPKEEACDIAVTTVRAFLQTHALRVIFNVFSDDARAIYEQRLSC